MSGWPRTRQQTLVRAAVIVAHPDDEILWMGGFLLMNAEYQWKVVTLCRGKDPDRAPKFSKVMKYIGAIGTMGDLDDGPDQCPLLREKVREKIWVLLGKPKAL